MLSSWMAWARAGVRFCISVIPFRALASLYPASSRASRSVAPRLRALATCRCFSLTLGFRAIFPPTSSIDADSRFRVANRSTFRGGRKDCTPQQVFRPRLSNVMKHKRLTTRARANARRIAGRGKRPAPALARRRNQLRRLSPPNKSVVCSITAPLRTPLEQPFENAVVYIAGNQHRRRYVLYFQTTSSFPSWMSRVRSPSPAPSFLSLTQQQEVACSI